MISSASNSEQSHETNEKSQSEEVKTANPQVQGPNILSTKQFISIYIGLLLSVFLISIDNTIVSTAQVPIVDDLGGASLVLWLPTAFLLAQASTTLTFGQILQMFPSKYVYLASLFFFELGSLISAVGNNMQTVIAGRAVSGFGAAGLFMGCFQILIETTTVASRAQYIGILGALFSISMIAGPSIGGALSQNVSWRWCFWINLPCAAVAAAGVLFILKATKPLGAPLDSKISLIDELKKLDIVGTILTGGFMVMIVVPIQLSTSQGWISARTLVPMCCSILVLPFIYLWSKYIGEDRALVSLKLLRDSNLIGCAGTSFFCYWNAIMFIYLVPLFFQTVEGHSSIKAGVDMLAMMITLAIFSVGAGILAKKTGHYYPYMPLAAICGMVGAGLMYKLEANSSSGFVIGTQILLGASFGPLLQTPILAVQANTKDKKLMSKATATVSVAQRLGGGIGGSAAGEILYAQLPSQVIKRLPADVDYVPMEVTAIYGMPLGPTRDAYLAGLTKVFDYIFVTGVPVYFIAFLFVVFLVKISDIREGKEYSKKDLIHRYIAIKKIADVSDAA